MLLAVLKDIFWENQFTEKGQGFDRDRYFMGLGVMLVFVSTMSAGAGMLYPYDGDMLRENINVFNLVNSLYNIHVLLGPVLLVLNVMLARRMFGPWLMVPFGLINSVAINLVGVLNSLNTNMISSNDPLFTVLLVVVGVFVLINIYPAFQPELARLQPNHPLLRLRSDIDEQSQFHAVKFFWRSFQLGLAALAALIVGIALVLLVKGPYHAEVGITLWLALVSLVTLVIGMVFLVRRLRNISLTPLPTILLLGLPAVFMIVYAVFYEFDFWGQFWLYLLMFIIFPWIRLMSFALQFIVLVRCPAEQGDAEDDESHM